MKKTLWILGIALLAAFVIWVFWANTALQTNTVTLNEAFLPEAFDGYRIAHVSDVHDAEITDKLIEMLKTAEPDIICITGDLMDCRSSDIGVAVEFAAKAAEIAPCYYVTGNHEVRLPTKLYKELLHSLEECGVMVLEEEEVILSKGNAEIALAGHAWGDTDKVGSISDFSGYRILLSHQPEAFDDYVAAGYDLVLTGHAHGGQFRLPFLGGLYAPSQGIFPKYDEGVHSDGRTDMIISRGIGNSTIPLRFNNRPELIVVVLESLTAAS